MATLMIRSIDDRVKSELRVLAARRGVSMEQQARDILERAVLGPADDQPFAQRIQQRFAKVSVDTLPLPERVEQARAGLPASVTLHAGDATRLQIAAESQDIVFAATVFSSLLDDAFQQRLADAMWRWVKPGGGVLWYDFTYDNPRNADVRGVPLARVRALFPHGGIDARRVTLAPPISRRVCRISPAAYGLFNALPFLRTHLLCWIAKPSFEPFAAKPGVVTTNAQVDALRDAEGI